MTILIICIVFAGILTQSIAGFGVALVIMPLLVPMVGLEIARPLIALIGITNAVAMVYRYRSQLSLKAVGGLTVASLVGIPLGEIALNHLDTQIVTAGLGLFIIGYGIYGLAQLHIPEIKQEGWSYVFGLASGVLSGAYNTGGPPLVIYGRARRWEPSEFKGNLQSIGLIKSVGVLATHAVAGNFTSVVWQGYITTLPAIAIGSALGFFLGDRLNAEVFQTVILVLLLVLGARLVVG